MQVVLLACFEGLQEFAAFAFYSGLGLREYNAFSFRHHFLAGLSLLAGLVLQPPQLDNPVILGQKRGFLAVAVVQPFDASYLLRNISRI
jgi:hypothetical protein